MGRKARYGLMLLATGLVLTATSASAVAETGGHFTSESAHTTLVGTESSASGHTTKIALEGGSLIECSTASYSGTTSSQTVTELKLTPSYSECVTAGSPGTKFTISPNGCSYTFKIGKIATNDNTLDINCPAEKSIEIAHPNCGIKIPSQSGKPGVAYKEIVENNKRALTPELTVSNLTAHYESGFCVFLGTTHTFGMTGSFTLRGTDTAGAAVGVRAIGSEDTEFQTEVSHTGLTATSSSSMTFGVLLGTVECTSATLDGTVSTSQSREIVVKPAYFGCKGTGREVTTHTNGCVYVLALTGAGGDGRVDIDCPVGKSIETTVDKFPEGCTITILDQTASGVVDYKEQGAGTGRDLLLTWTLEGLHYTRDGCEVGGTGNNGTMGGSITLSGEDTSGNPKGIWIE
jgi:hypothetical protein